MLGFSSNPFSVKPAAFHNELVGYSLEEVFNRIETGDVLFIQGNYGSGKTTLLKHIIRRFGGKKRVIYYNCSASERLDTKNLLLGRSLFSKILKVLPSDMILLVDEAQELKISDAKDLLPYFASNIKSVVFLGAQYKKGNFPKELKKFLDGNVVTLNKLTPEQAVELVRKRIGKIGILSDETIKKVYSYSGSNPRTLLENCEDLCRYAVDSESSTVTNDHIKAVLKKSKKPAKRVRKTKKTARTKRSRQKPEIKIEEISSDTSKKVGFEYNIDNIRTYEEEMDTLRNQ
jgi:chromosomal replication initiation ATPase DnaA